MGAYSLMTQQSMKEKAAELAHNNHHCCNVGKLCVCPRCDGLADKIAEALTTDRAEGEISQRGNMVCGHARANWMSCGDTGGIGCVVCYLVEESRVDGMEEAAKEAHMIQMQKFIETNNESDPYDQEILSAQSDVAKEIVMAIRKVAKETKS